MTFPNLFDPQSSGYMYIYMRVATARGSGDGGIGVREGRG